MAHGRVGVPLPVSPSPFPSPAQWQPAPRAPGTPAQRPPRTALPPAPWRNGRRQPRACMYIYKAICHTAYYATRFPHPARGNGHPAAPHRRTRAPRRSSAPPRPAPPHPAPQHRTAAPTRRSYAPQPPAAATGHRPTGPPPVGGSESRRRGWGGVVCGGLPYAYPEKGHFGDAGHICALYAPYMRPICAPYASVCTYPCGWYFISPEKPKKRENEKVVDL